MVVGSIARIYATAEYVFAVLQKFTFDSVGNRAMLPCYLKLKLHSHTGPELTRYRR